MLRHALVLLLSLGLAFGGCIELQALIEGRFPPSDGTPVDGGPDGLPGGNGNNGDPFVVRLSVSNPTPQVSEQVFLGCEVTQGDPEGVVFDFQPSSGRLAIDSDQGVASFIVQETDIGQASSFTCSARNALGQTATSSPAIITPSS